MINKKWFWRVLILLAICAYGYMFTHDPYAKKKENKEENLPYKQCLTKAFDDYNRLSLMLSNKDMHLEKMGEWSIEPTLKRRRLEENYCKRVAICDFIGANSAKIPMIFSLDFTSCLDDEDKERLHDGNSSS